MFTLLFAKKVGLSFLRAFVPFLALGLVGVWESFGAEGADGGKAALIALVGGAVTAGLRALQAMFTQLETPPELKQ